MDMEPILEGYIDLDSGTLGAVITADLVFLAGGRTNLVFSLQPVNGASNAYMGSPGPQTPPPALQDCAQLAEFFTGSFPIGTGVHICVLTNEGRLSLVWVESGENSPPYRVDIQFVTWK
jgi:hypothetical protein